MSLDRWGRRWCATGLVVLAVLAGRAGAQPPPLVTPAPNASAVNANGQFTLSWSDLTGGASGATMELRERVGTGSFGTPTDVTGTNSRTLTRQPGRFGFQLRLTEHESESNTTIPHSWSAETVVQVPAAGAPGAPSNLSGSPSPSTGTFTVSWSAPAGAVDHYRLEEDGPVGGWTEVWTGSGATTSLTRSDGSYSYQVQACNASNTCGGYSNTATVSVLGVPGVPGGLGPNATVGVNFTLRWGTATGTVHRYELHERTGTTGAWRNPPYRLTVRSRTFWDVEEGTYQYRVRACNANGLCGGYTAIKTVTVAPAANITGPAASRGIFDLSWTLPPSPGDIPRLQQRRAGSGSWQTVFDTRGRSSTRIFRVCSGCEGDWEYRLQLCDFEPGHEPICAGAWGAVHRVTVDHPANDVRTSASVPACTADDRARWEETVVSQEGVRVPTSWIGFDPARQPVPEPLNVFDDAIDKWFPIDGQRRTLCGVTGHFEIYDGFLQEYDFNHFILPTAAHSFILGNGQSAHCPGCVEVEVTPDTAFRNNPWFSQDGYSSLMCRMMCVHGPWVEDRGHDAKPEIHPAELTWWRWQENVGGTDSDLFRLLIVQDDSERFTWGSGRGDFRIAFEAPPGDATRSFSVQEETGWVHQNITGQDGGAAEDADDGREHSLVIDGREVARATEQQPSDDNIGVRFTDVCQESDGRVRGYLAIRSSVGRYSTVESGIRSGYTAIRVQGPHQAPPGPPSSPSSPCGGSGQPNGRRMLPLMVDGSVRRGTQDGQPVLMTDIEVRTREAVLPAKGTIIGATVRANGVRRPVVIEGKGPGGGDLLRGVAVPVQAEAVLELQLDSGEVVSEDLPAIALAPELHSATASATSAGGAGWGVALKTAGGRTDLPAPKAALLSVGRWDLQLDPEYGVVEGPGGEEESPVVEALNLALDLGGDSLALFGADPPLKTTWSFVATDLTTGARVPVVVGAGARAGEVRAELPAAARPGERLTVYFPTEPPGHVYEITATAHSLDVFGAQGETSHRLSSFVVSDETPEGLARALLVSLAPQTGLSAEALLALTAPPANEEVERAETARDRQARILYGRALRAASDRQVTVSELATLVQLAAGVAKP